MTRAEETWEEVCDISPGHSFWGRCYPLKHDLAAVKKMFDKLDFNKIKTFCSLKPTVQRMKRQCADWQNISAGDTSDEGLVFSADQGLAQPGASEQTAP